MMENKDQKVVIRLCRPDDAKDYAEIDRLERECAQGTILRFHFAPDDPKNPRPRALRFQNSLVTVAENAEGRLVGTVSGAIRNARFADGRFVKCGWVFSLRVGLDQRRTGVASKLLLDMERRMREEYGVKFCFDSIALDNMAAVRLFEKIGYSYMWKSRFYGINISHTKKMLDKRLSNTNALTHSYPVKRLDKTESRSFLHKHYSRSFLYPEDASTVLDSNVYVACSGENLVGVNVWADGEKLGIITVPWTIRLLYYVMIFLSFLFPNFFEKPLPLSRPWMMYFAYPIIIDCNSRDKNIARDLFNAAITQAVHDLHENGADVLNMPLEKQATGLTETYYNLVKKCPFLSPLMRGTGGMIAIGKCVDETTDGADNLSTASRQSFWFLNGSV